MTMEAFVTERLKAFCERTRMWGSLEAVELQAILLMECEVRATDPERMKAEPRLVLNTYEWFLPGGKPLHETIDEDRFGDALHAICQRVRAKLHESNPDPALVLESRDKVPPRVRDKLTLWDDEDLRQMTTDAVEGLGEDPNAVYALLDICQRMLVGHVYHVTQEVASIPGEVREVAERCLGMTKLHMKKGADDSNTEFVDTTHTVINRIAFVLHHERKAKLAAEAKADLDSRLRTVVAAWIAEHKPSCAESILQVDSVLETLPELAMACCEILGYVSEGDTV